MSARHVGFFLLAGLAALALGWFGADAMRSDTPAGPAPELARPDAPDPELPELRRQLEELRRDLDEERLARNALEAEVEALMAGLDETAELSAVAARGDEQEAAKEPAPKPSAPRPPRGTSRGRWLDKETLAQSGLGDTELQQISASFAAIEMERLDLDDEATREGWKNTPRYHHARRELAKGMETLRDEFGELRYDWILYSTGRPNRVVVQDVLDSSPARNAGLEPGDTVVRYDGARMFDQVQLVRATQSGVKGDLVQLEILRDGQAQSVYIPRGPLGVRIAPRSDRPDTIR